jgi:hypothetical protein
MATDPGEFNIDREQDELDLPPDESDFPPDDDDDRDA